MGARGFGVNEERLLASRLAGVLFLTAAVSILLLMLLPGVEDDHWPWVVGISAVSVAWAVYCLVFARPEEHGAWFWHTPATASVLVVSGLVAATGGSASPARFMAFFLLFFNCYFFPPRLAWIYVGGCVAIALGPLLYDRSAVADGYVGELIVLCAAYVTLGWLLIGGKAIMVELREQARLLSLRDALTDLPNRRALIEWLEAQAGTDAVGLILADLDGFKDVNTLHGYPAGDAVLCEAARTLQRAVRPGDFVARLGGDEFAVLTVGTDATAMAAVSSRLLDAVRDMDLAELEGVQLTVSAGWALCPGDAESIDELIAVADDRVRGAKLAGKDRVLSAVTPAA